MNTENLNSTLQAVFGQSERSLALMLLGPPGVGKTALVAQAAAAAGRELLTLALPTCEAVDLRGLPQVVGGRTTWASPLPQSGMGVLLLDEVSSALPDVQVAAHHLVWSEKGSDMNVPWHIVLTGNREQDKTVYRGLSGPLRNRLVLVEVEADLASWAKWAVNTNVHPYVIGFLRWRPEMLCAKTVPGEGAFTSPRAWSRVGSLLGLHQPINVERELLMGTIGEGATTEFVAYLRTARELPSIEAILKNPAKSEVPKSPSLLYALVTSLAQYTKERQISAMEYVKRMSAEMALLYITDIRDKYSLKDDPEIVEWVSKHKSIFTWGE